MAGVVLDGFRVAKYDRLVVCPEPQLDWNRVEGFVPALEKYALKHDAKLNFFHDLAAGGEFRDV